MRRKEFRFLAVLLMAFSSFAVACGGSETSSDPTTLNTVMSEEAPDLSPFTATGQGKAQIFSAIDHPLLGTDDTSKVVSQILESWETSDDGMTVTLVLKPKLEWSDGKPLTSADVLMSLTQYLDPNLSASAGRIGGVAGQEEYAAGTADTISGLAAPDELTVTVQLAKPDMAWTANVAAVGFNLPILPSHILGDVPHDKLLDDPFFKTHPVSSGPYQLVEFLPGQHAELKKNKNWSLGEAGFDKVFFKILTSDVASAQLETGEIQYMFPVDAADVDRIKRIEGVTVASHDGVAPEVLALNYADPKLQDPRIRQAMLYAIDRVGICKTVLAGHCTTPLTNIRQQGPEWAIPTDGVTTYDYDPEKAKQLLADAGWDPNTTLTLLTRSGRSYVDKAMTIAQGQLADVGMNFKLVNMDTSQLLETIKDPLGDAWQAFWVSGADFTIDPVAMQAYATCANRYPTGANTSQYCDPETDALLLAGRTESDQEKRGQLYQDAFRRLNQDPSEISLYVVDSIAAFDSRLKGVKVHGNLSSQYWNIGEWHWEA